MLDIKQVISASGTTPRTARGRAANGTTPVNLKVRLSAAQADKLERLSAGRGVSIAQVVRELVDACQGFAQ